MHARVLVAEKISPEGLETLRAVVEVTDAHGIGRQELLGRVREFDALIVRSGTRVDRELIDRGERLRVVGRAGVGVDNIDVLYATERGVLVVNAPESNIVAAAEHTMALILALAREIPVVDRELKGGTWSKARRKGVELLGKTLGIVGLGRVGSTVAVRAAAFGMRIVAYDPYIPLERFDMFGAERADTLEQLLAVADYITVHTPKTEETYGMIADRELDLAKDGVRVINCARGGIVDEAALVKALESGKAAAAGVDVFDQEPLNSHPLFDFDQVIVTPHLGGSTEEAQVRVGVTVAEQVLEALSGSLPKYALNLPMTEPETMARIRPFMPLLEALGSSYTQLFGLPIGGVEVRYCGEIGRHRTELATSYFMKGLRAPSLGDGVNIVNGRILAKRRGIDVVESTTTESGSYTSVVTAIGADDGCSKISGTLLGDAEPRIVEIDGFGVDVVPAGDVLVCWFEGAAVERPGIVGRVGALLSGAGVNIARMEVSRKIVGDRTIMVVSPSDPLTREGFEALSGLPGLVEVRLVRLSLRVSDAVEGTSAGGAVLGLGAE